MGLFEDIERENIDVLRDEPMKRHTSFKIGGPAKVYARPESVVQLKNLITLAKRWNTEYFVTGRGTNLLVGDKGIDKLVISTERMADVRRDEGRIVCSCGAGLTNVAVYAANEGLTGLEFAYGIPGSVGGAVVMNAGAYGGQMADVLRYVTVMDASGEVKRLEAGALEMGYRSSNVLSNGWTVLMAELELNECSGEAIWEKMEQLMSARRLKQPLEYPSAGSTFKRPEGDFAGRLIEEAGLKGERVNDACVSEKHAGFIVNLGNAKASDVVELIDRVCERVYARYGVELEPEIKFEGI